MTKKTDKRYCARCLAVLLTFLTVMSLSACGVALEDRVFPLSMGVDYQQGEYEVYYGIPDLSGVTGQSKDKESQNTGEKADVYKGADMNAAEEEFLSSQENYLDTGHVKVLLLGDGILKDKKALTGLLTYLEDKPSVAGNIYMFSCSDVSAVMSLDGKAMDSLGNYLTGIVENRPDSKAEEQPDLQDFYNAWHNKEDWPALLKVSATDDKVKLE